ncbi:MAG: hypothetical protein HY744_00485 [Deltaproteobacteria bacterium]|nr:hypothetical protein [Deltaproteobacteria bacterium]
MGAPRRLVGLVVLAAACAGEPVSPGGAGGAGGAAADLAARCQGLCQASVAQGCDADGAACQAQCAERFGGEGGCAAEALELVTCYGVSKLPADCSLSAACAVQAGGFAACRGALGCTQNLSCQAASPGCECTTMCAGFTTTTVCDPQVGQCRCVVEGAIGYAQADRLEAACQEPGPTNKWCQGQPFGCCLALF